MQPIHEKTADFRCESLAIPMRSGVRRWLIIAIAALAIAGIFSILLVAGRSPVVSDIVGVKDLFHVALAVHVDLSVWVWFLAMLALLWSWQAHATATPQHWWMRMVERYAQGCFIAGVVVMAISPWFGGEMITSNYVPMITNGMFYLSLALLMMGVVLALLVPVMARFDAHSGPAIAPLPQPMWQAGICGGRMIVAVALVALLLSGLQLNRAFDGDDIYFEHLYWGAGHIMQYGFTQLAMVLWALLAVAIGARSLTDSRLAVRMLTLNAALAVLALPIYAFYPPDDARFLDFFTQHMRHAGGIAPLVFGVVLLAALWRDRARIGWWRDALALSLVVSLLMFIVGGVLGWLIAGSNVTVPAHYHGMIFGITMATMAFIYWLLPRLGYADVRRWRSARWQPLIYGGGQLVHVVALGVSGGYGMLRKTPGAFEPGFNKVKLLMGIMGLGGAVAIVGGILFVVVCWRAMRKSNKPAESVCA